MKRRLFKFVWDRDNQRLLLVLHIKNLSESAMHWALTGFKKLLKEFMKWSQSDTSNFS